MLGGACLVYADTSGSDGLEWTLPNRRYRLLLKVDPGGQKRSNSPTAPLRIDFKRELQKLGSKGRFDDQTIEIVTYDRSGKPMVFDKTKKGYERYLLPWRVDKYYGIDEVDLIFVMPNHHCTLYAVYFDTIESGVGKINRYSGLVGDGDFFSEGYKRREVNACHFDSFCDLDGDGDLDLFKGGTEPFVYCYENVGQNRFVDRGRLTSGGELFVLPHGEGNGRSWVSLAFYDWDGDGDQDFFPGFDDGPYAHKIVYFENTTEPGQPPVFTDRGPLVTVSGIPLAGGNTGGGWFPVPTFVKDWDGDGDGLTDVLLACNHRCYLHRNLGPDGSGGWKLVDAVTVQAGGKEIVLPNPRFDVADIDSDGDLDLFAGCQPGPIYLFTNVGRRAKPVLAKGRILAFDEKYYIADAHSGVKVADFTGDGLLDFVVGRFWERMPMNNLDGPRDFGWMYENVGKAKRPRFKAKGAHDGAPYTERFQKCDAIRQNCVRAVDWDKDGRTDLLAGDTDGFLWYFQNRGSNLSPMFAGGEKIKLANGRLLGVVDSGGHFRHDICDWNNDGKRDLLVADGSGYLRWFKNIGADVAPKFGNGQLIKAAGKPIQHGTRSSVLVCDWNNDGKKDVIFAGSNDGYLFFENIGSDAQPELAEPKSLGLDMYIRPNLGSFVDWDGDGKKDFIGCNFENNIRLYKNVGSGKHGEVPRFSAKEGAIIVKPFTVMMTSGADAVDFNGDGDLDILTGQGHAGSGLRFFERDYIRDCMNDSHPTITVVSGQRSGVRP
jgi:hypothetical protein